MKVRGDNRILCSFLGHNGAGKSTTINMLTGLLNQDSGNIYCKILIKFGIITIYFQKMKDTNSSAALIEADS